MDVLKPDPVLLVRYDVRPDEHGWTIYDCQTDRPGSVHGYDTVGLMRMDADEIADLLNTLAPGAAASRALSAPDRGQASRAAQSLLHAGRARACSARNSQKLRPDALPSNGPRTFARTR